MKAIQPLGAAEFRGDIRKPKNVSAVQAVGDDLIVGADETNAVQVLRRRGDGYEVLRDVTLNAAAGEIDIEGVAAEGDAVYVLGSHSWKRKKVDPGRPYAANRAALEAVAPEPDRDHLFRFRLGGHGPPDVEDTTLRPFIDGNATLKTFSRVPGKENGVDLEGVAARDGRLYVGCRSPVLRENWVPVVTCRFGRPVTEADLAFVNLGGRGVRDLTAAGQGFLILAGPPGDGPGSYQVYFWDGDDCLPGERPSERAGRLELLGEVPGDAEAKAEGLTMLKEDNSAYEVPIVYDGVKNGGPTRFRVPKP